MLTSRKVYLSLALIPIPICIILAGVILRLTSPSSVQKSFEDHTYSTSILSIDPLVIYVKDFVTSAEADYLVDLGNPMFTASRYIDPVTKKPTVGSHRNSSTAYLPRADQICDRVSQRALSFLGFLPNSALETIQIVRYYPGQHFSVHHDGFQGSRKFRYEPHKDQSFRRLSSFFVYLSDDTVGGETYFPLLNGVSDDGDESRFSRSSTGEGLLVKPMKGSGIFWVNVLSNGTLDRRVQHSGLPVKEGVKYGMNMWSPYFEGESITDFW